MCCDGKIDKVFVELKEKDFKKEEFNLISINEENRTITIDFSPVEERLLKTAKQALLPGVDWENLDISCLIVRSKLLYCDIQVEFRREDNGLEKEIAYVNEVPAELEDEDTNALLGICNQLPYKNISKKLWNRLKGTLKNVEYNDIEVTLFLQLREYVTYLLKRAFLYLEKIDKYSLSCPENIDDLTGNDLPKAILESSVSWSRWFCGNIRYGNTSEEAICRLVKKDGILKVSHRLNQGNQNCYYTYLNQEDRIPIRDISEVSFCKPSSFIRENFVYFLYLTTGSYEKILKDITEFRLKRQYGVEPLRKQIFDKVFYNWFVSFGKNDDNGTERLKDCIRSYVNNRIEKLKDCIKSSKLKNLEKKMNDILDRNISDFLNSPENKALVILVEIILGTERVCAEDGKNKEMLRIIKNCLFPDKEVTNRELARHILGEDFNIQDIQDIWTLFDRIKHKIQCLSGICVPYRNDQIINQGINETYMNLSPEDTLLLREELNQENGFLEEFPGGEEILKRLLLLFPVISDKNIVKSIEQSVGNNPDIRWRISYKLRGRELCSLVLNTERTGRGDLKLILADVNWPEDDGATNRLYLYLTYPKLPWTDVGEGKTLINEFLRLKGKGKKIGVTYLREYKKRFKFSQKEVHYRGRGRTTVIVELWRDNNG